MGLVLPEKPGEYQENYDRFMERCEIFLPHADCVLISVAYALAKHYHRFDVRKDELDENGEPLRYFEHVRRVAIIIIDELALPDLYLIIEGLLHDAPEDTRLAPEAITRVFGAEVGRNVMLMSKKPKQGFHQRLLDHADWRVLIVKGCDRLDNVRSLVGSSPEFRAKQIKETRLMYYPLMDVLIERAPDDVLPQVRRLKALLLAETERMAEVSRVLEGS
jgi:GTP pyrophosphokinase